MTGLRALLPALPLAPALLAPALLALAFAFPAEAGAQDLPAGGRYVAIGDSFASGLQLGPPDAGTPPRCSRTAASYAHLVAQRLNLVLADVTCSSAKTEHVLGKWDELPPQIDAVTPDTRLVTVTIGANDVRYVSDFFAGLCRLSPETRSKPECATLPPLPTEAAWTALEDNLHLVASQIRAKAPDARLIFIDYLALLPRLVLCDRTPLTPAEASDRRGVGDRLHEVIARVARQENALLIEASRLSRSHTPCSVIPWTSGFPGFGTGPAWHPTALGHAAIADEIVRRLAPAPGTASPPPVFIVPQRSPTR